MNGGAELIQILRSCTHPNSIADDFPVLFLDVEIGNNVPNEMPVTVIHRYCDAKAVIDQFHSIQQRSSISE